MHRTLLNIARLIVLSILVFVLPSCGGGHSGGNGVVNIPAAPAGVVATPASGQVTVSWNAVPGATSYNVYWSTTSGVTKATGTRIAGAANPYTQKSLSNGTTYYFIVTAVNSAGESAASAQANATPTAPVTAPAAPGGVTATPGNGRNTIGWAPVSGATSYNLYWSTTTGVTTTSGTKIASITNPYTQTGLTNGTAYYYVVTAVNAAGESAASAQVTATPNTAPPAAPTGVVATAGNGQNSIAWNPVSGAASYNLYWSNAPGVTTVTGTKVANATSPYLQTGLTNGTTYYYVVTAVSASGESGTSAEVAETPSIGVSAPPAPTGVAAVTASNQATLTWAPVTGVVSYNLYYSTTAGVTPANGTAIAGVTSPYTLTGLANGTTYYFVVTAVNAGGESSPSAQVSAAPVAATAAPAAPGGVTAAAGNGQNTVSWVPTAGATSYNVYWSTTSSVSPATGTKVVGAPSPYVQTGLTNGTAYYYVVTAVNSAGESAPSAVVSGIPFTAPTGLVATPANGQVTLTWNALPGASSYNVYWSSPTSITPATAHRISGIANPVFLFGSYPNSTYYFMVTAMIGGVETAPSNEVIGLPQIPTSVPTAPTGVVATAGNSQNTLWWTPVTGATSYNVYWSTTSGVTPATGTKIASVQIPYTHAGLTNGTTYYYVVTGVNGLGEGPPSAQATATPVPIALPAPTGVAAIAGNGQNTLSWNPVSGATFYNVYWSTASGVTPANGTKIANVTNPFTQTALTNGTAYYYVVTAANATGESPPSAQVSTVAGSCALSMTPITASRGIDMVTLSWTTAGCATSYNIYWSTASGVTPANGAKIAGITGTSYVQAGLTAGKTYYYVATAVDSYGNESAPSAEASALVQQGTNIWIAGVPMPASYSSMTGGVINGKLYFAGGANGTTVSSAAYVFDPVANVWATLAPMPTGRSNAMSGVINGILYVVGGSVGASTTTNVLEAYNPVTKTWAALAPMPTPRSGAAAGVINGKLYVAGGSSTTCPPCALSAVESYDPATNAWTIQPAMPVAAGQTAGTVINGLLYVVGGVGTNSLTLPPIQVFNPATGGWTTTPLGIPTSGLAVQSFNGILYEYGGLASGNYAYNPQAGTWTSVAPMVGGYSGMNSGNTVLNGQIYVVLPGEVDIYIP